MGTSASSKGPVGGVPMVPPWADPPNLPLVPIDSPQLLAPKVPSDDSLSSDEYLAAASDTAQSQPNPIATQGRFSAARRNLAAFSHDGNAGKMRRGVGQYVRKGYGGAETTARRFSRVATTASALYFALGAPPVHAVAPESTVDITLRSASTAKEVIDAVIEVVRPIDGTLDSEAERKSISDALCELLSKYPEADLVNLSEEERLFAVEQFLAYDIFCRVELDIGSIIQERATSIAEAQARRHEIREYIKEIVSSRFRSLVAIAGKVSSNTITQIVKDTLLETFQVFEGYA